MKKILITLILLTAMLGARAQSVDTLAVVKAITEKISGQKTANSKDILTTFFRAGVENLLGDDRKFTLNSSFYGLDSIFRKNGKNPTYNQERKWRNNSVNFGLESDEENNLTKFNLGFTISVLNRTNIKLTKFKKEDGAVLDTMGILISAVQNGFITFIRKTYESKPIDFETNRAIMKTWSDANKSHDYKDIHPLIKAALRDSSFVSWVMTHENIEKPKKQVLEQAINSILEGKDIFNEIYQGVVEKYARRPILTVIPNAAYDRSTKQGEYSLGSDFTVGLTKNPAKKPWEIEAKLRFRIGNDTTVNNANYKNKPLSVSVGINKILIRDEDKASKMEFKLFTQYDHQFGSAKVATDKELFTFNSTLRINIHKSLWLPLTIKYDPKNANVFGFFSFTANLGN